MATKKATTSGTKYHWYVFDAVSHSIFNNDCGWSIGECVSIDEVISSHQFREFMTEADSPERVYLIATTTDGKAHRFHRLEVKSSGFSYKEV